MNRFDGFLRWAHSVLVICMLAFALGACSGDDGRDGADGADGVDGVDGVDGTDGASATITPLESCGVCHDEGSFASAPVAHELPPIESYSNVTFAVNGADLDVTFDLAADGVAATDYNQLQRGYRNPGDFEFDICNAPSRSDPCDPASLTLTNNGSGNYTIKVLGGAAEAATDNRYMFRVGVGSDRETRVYFYGDFPASPFEPVAVTAEACENCHGPEGIDVHGGYYVADDGGEPCLICHGSDRLSDGVVEEVPSLGMVSHEYHSGLRDEITYPTYTTNCSVCHNEPLMLAAVNAMPVTGSGCFSCHGSMASSSWDFTATPFHVDYDETTDCQTCHIDGGIARPIVTLFHNGWETPRHGFIWDGIDTSVTEGAKFAWEITGVVDDGTDLAISWQASYLGVGVDPCNATVGAGAPVFFAGEGDLSMYRSYAQGGDFIIGMSTSAPGQAVSVDLTVDNTTCAAGIATTIIPVDVVDAETGRLALGGKPLVVSVVDPALAMEARVPTPTYDWLVGDGSAPLEARRDIVDTGECLKCHVGSLYQHGGDRVDNVDMCLVCHNSASNEKNVRVGMGVDPSEAYDGGVGETFEMKTMLHRIHSTDADVPPYVIYRNRGIYAFATDDSLLPNWPGTGDQVVFGSDPEVITNHHFETPTYPRSLNDCAACHTRAVIPNQTEAMAATVDAGGSVWQDQLDDVLQGAATTACITCHADGAAKGHAYQNSWDPQEFPEGRQTIIDAAN